LLEFEAKVREGIEAAIANNAPPGCNTKTESPEDVDDYSLFWLASLFCPPVICAASVIANLEWVAAV
jgi:hypothetical protein